MHIDWWTLGPQAVNALVLIWLQRRLPTLSNIAGKVQGRRGRGDAEKSALLGEAQADAHKLRAAAKVEIEAERRSEALAAEDRAGRLAIDIATKLLDRLPQEARVAAFIDGIAKLPEGTRASLGAGGAAIHLTAARTVTPQEVEACRKTLAGVLGHPVLVEVSVDPELIAGIELEARHAVVRNSFRADLVRLKSELVHHDTDAT